MGYQKIEEGCKIEKQKQSVFSKKGTYVISNPYLQIKEHLFYHPDHLAEVSEK